MKCVHLDFHTGPAIPDIGKDFNKAEFTKTLKDAKVDLITVFAKCHHGYTYYPSKIGTMHPGLNFNLLKEEIEAVHDAGAKAPIYITVGWSKKDADEHPEWHHIDFYTGQPVYTGAGKPSDDPEAPIKDCSWLTLCPVGGYQDYLESITREVCESFDVADGIFYDICFIRDACACESCKAGMKAMGLDPTNIDDARKYYKLKRIEMMKRLTGVVHEYSPNAPVFYNGGAEMNRTEYHPYQTHFELEDLPTSWGGYDNMPLRAKFFQRYGKYFMGMTGKFHHNWGEFGGFKNKDALKYECADMLSVGASISVGDHLHPCGKLDEGTYELMGYAFDYVDSIAKYTDNTEAITDIAIWLSHAGGSDLGASKLLQIMQIDFDVIESGSELGKYKCVIMPDRVKPTDTDKAALAEFVKNGGSVIASYASGCEEIGVKKITPSPYDQDYIQCDFAEYKTPFLAYSTAYRTECEGETLAAVYEPYFSRTVGHFCGHKNTPYKTEKAEYPALVQNGNVIYFAHPVFEAYNKSGNYVLEKYVTAAIERVYDKYIKVSGLPSCGRVRLRGLNQDGTVALHLLYATPVNRGNVCLLTDFPTLHGVTVEIKTDKTVTEVLSRPDDTPIPFTQNGDTVTLQLPPFSLHKLITIK